MTTPQLHSHATLAAQLMQHITALCPDLTDMTPGSVVRTIAVDAPAAALQQLEHLVFTLTRQGIETGTYRNFDFHRLPSHPATGTVRFTRTTSVDAVTIPAGTRVAVPGHATRLYDTLAEASMGVGVSSVDVPVRCTSAGASGNTAAGTVTQLVSSLSFVPAVTNPWPFLDGKDEETDEERFTRFQLYMRSFSRGTLDALRYAALQVALTDADGVVTERVAGVYVREPFLEDPPGRLGLIEVYVDNGGGSASGALVEQVKKVLQGYTDEAGVTHKGWKSAGCELRTFAVVGQMVDVTATITVAPGFAVAATQTAVAEAITTYLQGLAVFETAYRSQMMAAALRVAGVRDVTITTPTTNVTPQLVSRIIPGVITVS